MVECVPESCCCRTARRPSYYTRHTCHYGLHMTPTQRLAMYGVVGLGATVLVLLAISGTANAAAPAPAGMNPTDGGRGQAATALASAIQTAGGYQGSQASLVVAYEQAAGLSVDAGLPGAQVMSTLRDDLAAMGTSSTYPLIGTIAVYPWTGGWTSGNVPAAFADNTGSAWSAGTAVGT